MTKMLHAHYSVPYKAMMQILAKKCFSFYHVSTQAEKTLNRK